MPARCVPCWFYHSPHGGASPRDPDHSIRIVQCDHRSIPFPSSRFSGHIKLWNGPRRHVRRSYGRQELNASAWFPRWNPSLRLQVVNSTRRIRKYPNRQLYDVAAGHYITFSDLGRLMAEPRDLVVVDVKTNRDITREMLLSFVINQEASEKALTCEFLLELIRCSAEGCSKALPRYLEESLSLLSSSTRASPHPSDAGAFEQAGRGSC